MPRIKGKPQLNKEQIVNAAIDLADRAGMGSLTMRRLATELDVRPMALYHYFEDKTALLHAVIDAVLSGCEAEATGSWTERVVSLCRSYREVAHRHPAVFMAAMNHEEIVQSDLVIAEGFLNALASGGIPPKTAVRGYNTLITFVTGFAVDEISGLLFTFDKADELLDALPAERFPQLLAHRDYLTFADSDAEFTFGLSALLEGLQSRVPADEVTHDASTSD